MEFTFYNDEEKCFEVGYNIMHKYWNQGYTTEIVKAILDFAEKELDLIQIDPSSFVMKPNDVIIFKNY